MNTLALALIIPLLLFLLPILCAVPLAVIDTWGKWDKRRKIRREYDEIVNAWKLLAFSETNPEQKGFEVAMLCNVAYEKNTLYPKGLFMK